jgi:hypothetical protein
MSSIVVLMKGGLNLVSLTVVQMGSGVCNGIWKNIPCI